MILKRNMNVVLRSCIFVYNNKYIYFSDEKAQKSKTKKLSYQASYMCTGGVLFETSKLTAPGVVKIFFLRVNYFHLHLH